MARHALENFLFAVIHIYRIQTVYIAATYRQSFLKMYLYLFRVGTGHQIECEIGKRGRKQPTNVVEKKSGNTNNGAKNSQRRTERQ